MVQFAQARVGLVSSTRIWSVIVLVFGTFGYRRLQG